MPASLVFTITDGKTPGKTSNVLINIPTATTVANATTFAQTVAALIDALISGIITHIGLCYQVALPGGLSTTPNAFSDVEEGAVFSFNTAAGVPTKFRLPTFNETAILSGTKVVDIADPDVAALITAMVTGSGGVAPVDSRDSDVTALRYAREMFTKDRG